MEVDFRGADRGSVGPVLGALAAALRRANADGAEDAVAHVAPDDSVAIRCLLRVGFEPELVGPGDEAVWKRLLEQESRPPASCRFASRDISLAKLPRYALMGVVNVTPDSFSDGGVYESAAAATAHGRSLVAGGAAILDVGGESTRPGAEPVDDDTEELRRSPWSTALAGEQVIVPVEHRHHKAAVAGAALAAGATIVNDVSGGTLRRPDCSASSPSTMPCSCSRICRASRARCTTKPHYDDVVARSRRRICAARVAGRIGRRRSASTRSSPIPASASARPLSTTSRCSGASDVVQRRAGAPLVVGASRKSFLGAVIGDGGEIDVHAREEATLATTVRCFTHGARVVRVHDVAASVRARVNCSTLDRTTPTSEPWRRDQLAGPLGPGTRSHATSRGSSWTGSARANGRAASRVTTARCAARKS